MCWCNLLYLLRFLFMRDKENLRKRRKENYQKNREKVLLKNRIYWKQYRLLNKEKLKQKNKDYYQNNKEKIIKQTNEYQRINKDKVNTYNRLRYSKGIWIEKRKQNRLSRYEKNKEYEKEYNKKYRKTEQWIIGIKIRNHKYRAQKISTYDWTITKQFIKWLLINQKYKCNICSISIKDKYHIDHIYPLSKWWLHTASNIQILCRHCNLCKWNKILS